MSGLISFKNIQVTFTPRRVAQTATHLVALLILFLLPVVFVSIDDHVHGAFANELYIKAVIWTGVFYASYYLTSDPTTGKPGAIPKFLLQVFAIAFVAIIALHLMRHFHIHFYPDSMNHHAPHGPRPPRGLVGGPEINNLMMVFLTVGLGQAIKFIYKTYNSEQTLREFEARERDAELRQLKAQIKPHFLFNTLNSIYALVAIDPCKAQNAIHSLSKLLRYTLNDTLCLVALEEDVRFITNYVDLMKLRMQSGFTVRTEIELGNYNKSQIPPLMFINIVENAFKHATNTASGGVIMISVTADNNTVTCHTVNPYNGEANDNHSSGIGISNLRRRLDIIYPGKYSLTMAPAGNTFTVNLSIDISTPPAIILEAIKLNRQTLQSENHG